ncbi:TetR/AcrR family transcriptional regulator [Kribbella solani]|uniref:AcrR family transcriptional regulator n=1 Tax=Kribbella solani TaxID=236067 RepID=A0A841DLB2_9ACTN|nr:TetR/AcrR family transcriptional regulator [Kribbella solani]MBB5979433.1 AcrR family transcriptional regulator [Kribbella solani]MDX2969630.1 TetR family transcriptional regulator [Kribbella solani]MDX3003226.1 TetR family transcriptional regulator [Kribbella solani]
MVDDGPLSRAERRQRTEAAILTAARRQFGELGYERTSIRGVAGEAGIDPALVMQLFGSKERLFSAAAASGAELGALTNATAGDLARAAAAHLFAEFEDPERRGEAATLLRSCLTHPAAGEVLRDQVMAPAQAAVAATIGGDDSELRAAVLNACTLGVTITRYLLQDPVLAAADRQDVEEILRPALQAVIDGTAD